jgi:hypothetical protein
MNRRKTNDTLNSIRDAIAVAHEDGSPLELGQAERRAIIAEYGYCTNSIYGTRIIWKNVPTMIQVSQLLFSIVA